MMGLKFMDDVPFREIYITGLIRDGEGQKMSKSKGNVLDPLDLIDGIDLESLVEKRTSGMMQPQKAKKIEKATRKEFADGIPAFGSDALRFTFLALATNGRDIRFDLGRAGGYRNFCNKLWNAARYVLMQCEGQDCGVDNSAQVELSVADRWIISRLQQAEKQIDDHINGYRFDLAARALYEFIWNEYCDWYLELSKVVMNDDAASDQAKRGTRRTLVRVLEATLRLAHPFLPFITEEIWQKVGPLAGVDNVNTIMLQGYPQADEARIDTEAEADIAWLQGFILGLRQIRGEMDISPGKPLPVLLQNASKADISRLQAHRPILDFLGKLESADQVSSDAPDSAMALLGDMKILVPMAGLIDKDAELSRLNKRISKMEQEVQRAEAKLANPGFTDKAPPAVVEKARAQLADQQQALQQLRAQHERIAAL